MLSRNVRNVHVPTDQTHSRDEERTGWARVLEFPRPPVAGDGVGGLGSARPIPPHLAALAAKVEATRGDLKPEVSDRVALSVVAAGLVLCTIGTVVTPTSRTETVDLTWFAEVVSTIFWGGACMGAIGLFFRVRRGLFAATVAALAFLSAPIVSAVADPEIIGRGWAAELVCAVEFLAVCCCALWISRPTRPATMNYEPDERVSG